MEMEVGLLPREVWILDLCLGPGYEDWLVPRLQGRGTVTVAGEDEEVLDLETRRLRLDLKGGG